jgi:hypothetical protein
VNYTAYAPPYTCVMFAHHAKITDSIVVLWLQVCCGAHPPEPAALFPAGDGRGAAGAGEHGKGGRDGAQDQRAAQMGRHRWATATRAMWSCSGHATHALESACPRTGCVTCYSVTCYSCHCALRSACPPGCLPTCLLAMGADELCLPCRANHNDLPRYFNSTRRHMLSLPAGTPISCGLEDLWGLLSCTLHVGVISESRVIYLPACRHSISRGLEDLWGLLSCNLHVGQISYDLPRYFHIMRHMLSCLQAHPFLVAWRICGGC